MGADVLSKPEGGFTLIEIVIAISILSVAVLGIASSTARMLIPATVAELEFQALQSVESRMALIRLEPRYTLLDSLYEGTTTNMPGLTDVTRTTAVTRKQVDLGGGKMWDYTEVVVTMSGGRLPSDISRKVTIGAS